MHLCLGNGFPGTQDRSGWTSGLCALRWPLHTKQAARSARLWTGAGPDATAAGIQLKTLYFTRKQ